MNNMSPLAIVLLVLVVVILLGGISGPNFGVPYGYGLGNSGVGLVTILLVVLVVLLFTGRLRL
jgi:hypothetical protein